MTLVKSLQDLSISLNKGGYVATLLLPYFFGSIDWSYFQVRTKLSSNQFAGLYKEVACGGNALGFYAAVRMRTSRRELRYSEDQVLYTALHIF